jgi:hypothetical protein
METEARGPWGGDSQLGNSYANGPHGPGWELVQVKPATHWDYTEPGITW